MRRPPARSRQKRMSQNDWTGKHFQREEILGLSAQRGNRGCLTLKWIAVEFQERLGEAGDLTRTSSWIQPHKEENRSGEVQSQPSRFTCSVLDRRSSRRIERREMASRSRATSRLYLLGGQEPCITCIGTAHESDALGFPTRRSICIH
jgi:hypothetical protein